jgi:hypothetical protein
LNRARVRAHAVPSALGRPLGSEVVSGRPLDWREPSHRPTAVALEIPAVAEIATAAQCELRKRALVDRDRCRGYFPALDGAPGILADLPACREFAARLPQIRCSEVIYRFNFLRLSLVQQSADPAYHLDSDADTAITGDLATLRKERVLRLLLNMSTRTERNLHYLDIDPRSVELDAERVISMRREACRAWSLRTRDGNSAASRLPRRRRRVHVECGAPLGCGRPSRPLHRGLRSASRRLRGQRRVVRGWRAERSQHMVSQLALSRCPYVALSKDPLAQLARLPAAPTAVRNCEIVEDEKLPWRQRDLD